MTTGEALSAVSELERVQRSVKAKADRYKGYARAATAFQLVAAASVPALIGLSGDNFFWGKVLPSALSALTAVVAGLVAVERPHERWNLYRRYQRLLEGEGVKHRFGVAPYGDGGADQQLAASLAQIQLDLHDEWSGLLPSRRELAGLKPGAT